MTVPEFGLLGTRIVESSVRYAGEPAEGSINDTEHLEFPSGIEFAFRGRRKDDVMREGAFVLDRAATGTLNDIAGTIDLHVELESDDPPFVAEGTLRARFIARPPRASLQLPPTSECTSTGGAFVPVDLSATEDPDDDVVSFLWQVDGAWTPNNFDSEILVPLGAHSVAVAVADRHGFYDTDSASTTVVDTTAPTVDGFIYDGPVCLWPPNHGYIVLRVGRDFEAIVSDACDPNPTFEILAASSSQPDDGLGDGDTANDVVAFPDHVCLRAERSGTIDEGRIYTIDLAGVDAAGNEGEPTVRVRVGHDQRPDDRCRDLPVLEMVDDEHPVCVPLPPAVPALPPPRANSADANDPGGCASSPLSAPALLPALLLLRKARRRERRNQ